MTVRLCIYYIFLQDGDGKANRVIRIGTRKSQVSELHPSFHPSTCGQ